MTDDEGAYKASAFFADDKAVEEFNSDFEKLGPLAFGFHDGQTEAPKIQAQSVRLIVPKLSISFCLLF